MFTGVIDSVNSIPSLRRMWSTYKKLLIQGSDMSRRDLLIAQFANA